MFLQQDLIPLQSILLNKKENFASDQQFCIKENIFILKPIAEYLSRHVSKFCYKQSTLLLSCCCILSNIHFFNSVERSSIACREEASDQVASGFSFESDCVLVRGACFLDPMQSEISRNRSNRELHWTLGRKLLQAALNWTTIRLQQYKASQSES